MNQHQPSHRLVEWWQVTGDDAPDVAALEKAVNDVQRERSNEWKSVVLDAFMAPPETPGESEAPEEKTGGGTIWQALQAIAVLVLALMATVFIITSILRNSGDRSVEPTLATVAQDVAPTVQALSGRLDALAARVEDLDKQFEKALSTPIPAPAILPTSTPMPTPSPLPSTPIPSPTSVISLQGRVEPAELAQRIALSVKIGQDGVEWVPYGNVVIPAATGAFTLTFPAGWEGNLLIEWETQEVVVKGVAPEDKWIPEKDPWSGFVASVQSRTSTSSSMALPNLTIALEPVPQPERFLSELSGKLYDPSKNRRSFPIDGRERTGNQSSVSESLRVLGQAQVLNTKGSFTNWRMACCDEITAGQSSFFWAGTLPEAPLIQLVDERQAASLPTIYLPQEVNSVETTISGWIFEEIEGISVLVNQPGEAQELIWSVAAPQGWFRLQAWRAAGSTAEASYEVLIGAGNAPLRPIAGTTVVPPPTGGATSGFADIGMYYLTQPQSVTVRLKAPASGRVGVGLIRVLRPKE